MTLPSTTTKVQYNGDGATASFPITFVFWNNSDVRAVHRDSAGVETVWVEGTHYTVTGGAGSTGTLAVETTPTDYTPAAGETLTIKSNLTLTQADALPLGGKFPSTTVEQRLDKTVRQVQQLDEALDRSVQLPESSAASGLALPEPEASKQLAWNAGGTALENTDGVPGPTGATGAAGADGSDGTSGVFVGTEDTVAPTTADKLALLDNSDSDAPKFATLLTLDDQDYVDVATAASPDIGATNSRKVRLTGTTGVTGFATAPAGRVRLCRAAAIFTMTHNATSLILVGAANITTAAGDTWRMISRGSGNWLMTDYTRADGTALVTSGGSSITGGERVARFTDGHGQGFQANVQHRGVNVITTKGNVVSLAMMQVDNYTPGGGLNHHGATTPYQNLDLRPTPHVVASWPNVLKDQTIAKCWINNKNTAVGYTVEGDAFGWGANGSGQIGDGTTALKYRAAIIDSTDIGLESGNANREIIDMAFSGSVQNDANHNASCSTHVVCQDGSVWAYGYNGYGQLADNTTTARSSPVQCQKSGGGNFTNAIAIWAGGENYASAYVLCSDGTFWAVGYNGTGQLCDTTTTNRSQFIQIDNTGGLPDGTVDPVVSFEQLHSASNATMMALTAAGVLVGWGVNAQDHIQSGGGNLTTSVAVATGVRRFWTFCASNPSLYWVRDSDANFFFRGYNGHGQAGNGNTTKQSADLDLTAINVPDATSGEVTRMWFNNYSTGSYQQVIAECANGFYCTGYNNINSLPYDADDNKLHTTAPANVFRAANLPKGVANDEVVDFVMASYAGSMRVWLVTTHGEVWFRGRSGNLNHDWLYPTGAYVTNWQPVSLLNQF